MSACTAPAPPLAAQLRFILPPCLRPYPWQVWEDGQAFKDVHARLRALAEQRESIEAARKAAKKRLPLPGQVPPAAAAGGSEAAAPGSMLHPDDWVVQVGQAGGGGVGRGAWLLYSSFFWGSVVVNVQRWPLLSGAVQPWVVLSMGACAPASCLRTRSRPPGSSPGRAKWPPSCTHQPAASAHSSCAPAGGDLQAAAGGAEAGGGHAPGGAGEAGGGKAGAHQASQGEAIVGSAGYVMLVALALPWFFNARRSIYTLACGRQP